MRKFLIVILGLFFVSAVSADTATFQTDETQTVNIGGSPVTLELIGVSQNDEHPEMYSGTFVDSEGMTITVTSWNSHEYDHAGSNVNGEEVGLMNWQGVDTDTNTDDTATIAWGREYFECESYSPEGDEFKFCSGEEKTFDINGETSLEFQYVRTDDEHKPLKHAAFLNGEGQTVTLSSENAPEFQHTLGSINGRTAYLTETRGSNTERGSDDAVLFEVRDSEMYSVEIVVSEKNGKTVEFRTNAESSIGIDTVEWDLNDDNQYETEGRTVETTFDETGEKTVNLRVQDAEQSQTASKTVEIEENTDYSLRNYQPGDRATLRAGQGLLFNDQTFYFDEISQGWVYGWANEVKDMSEASQEEINSHRSGVDEGGSTVQAFGQTEYAIAGCEVSENEATVVIKKTGEVTDNWPESHCEQTQIDYSVQEAENVKNFLGGKIDGVTSGTHIKFGNDLQNSLYIKNIQGETIRQVQIEASAGSKDAEAFSLNWDNMVQGVRKEFSTGEYTVHLCGDSDPSEGGITISIAKQEGTNGYSTCFTDEKQGLGAPSEYTDVAYELGQKVNVSTGEKISFGQENRNTLYIDNFTYSGNIDRYSLEAYANKLVDNNRLRPVRGTSMDTYFYTGGYTVDFCNYYEGEEKGEIVIGEEDGQSCTGEADRSDEQSENTDEVSETFEVEVNPVEYNQGLGVAIVALPIDGEIPVEQISDDCEIFQDVAFGFESGGLTTHMLNGMRGYAVITESTESCTATVQRSAVSGTLDVSLPDNEWVVASVPREMTVEQLDLGEGCTLNGIGDTLIWKITAEGNQALDQGTTLKPDQVYWIRAEGTDCSIGLDENLFNVPGS